MTDAIIPRATSKTFTLYLADDLGPIEGAGPEIALYDQVEDKWWDGDSWEAAKTWVPMAEGSEGVYSYTMVVPNADTVLVAYFRETTYAVYAMEEYRVQTIAVSGGLSKADVSEAVWDEPRTSHADAGSFGEGVASVQGDVAGNIDGNIGGDVPSIQAILENATYGLAALNIDLDLILSIIQDGTYGLSAIQTIVATSESHLADPDTGLVAINAKIVDIYANTQAILDQIGTATPISDLDTLWKILEATHSVVESFAGGGLGERIVTQTGFLDGQVPPVFHENGSGPVVNGEGAPLDDVNVLAYIETPGTGKWRTLIARTVTDINGNWNLMLDDATYILWFYRADKITKREWRAISIDGSTENPTTNPEDYI